MNIATIQGVKGVVTCAEDGTAEHVFNIKNATDRARRIGIHLLVPEGTPEGWLTIDEPTEYDLDVEGMTQIRVKIQAPTDGTPGQYSYRLRVFDPDSPGEHYATGDPVYFEVSAKEGPVLEPEKPKKPFPWWIAAAAAGVVVAGLLIWVLMPSGVELPDFTEGDWDRDTAVAFLEENGLEHEIELQEVSNSRTASAILDQTPEPNMKVEKGETVTLKVAGVKVPKFIDGSLSDAVLKIRSRGLELGDDLTIKSVGNQDQHDKVLDQDPEVNTLVPRKTPVNLVVGQYQRKDFNLEKVPQLKQYFMQLPQQNQTVKPFKLPKRNQ